MMAVRQDGLVRHCEAIVEEDDDAVNDVELEYCQSILGVTDHGTSYHANWAAWVGLEYRPTSKVVSTTPVGVGLLVPQRTLIKDNLPLPATPATARWNTLSLY